MFAVGTKQGRSKERHTAGRLPPEQERPGQVCVLNSEDVWAYGGDGAKVQGVALFEVPSFLNHSATPNVNVLCCGATCCIVAAREVRGAGGAFFFPSHRALCPYSVGKPTLYEL